MKPNAVERINTGQPKTHTVEDIGDYTLFRRQMFDDMTLEEVLENTSEYMKTHPLSTDTKTRLEWFRNEGS